MKTIKHLKVMLICTLCLCVAVPTFAFAETDNIKSENENAPTYEELIKDPDVVILNEIDIMSDLKKQTDDTLKKDGFSEKAIQEIREFDPRIEIKKLSCKSEDELKSLNFTDTEINKIQSVKDLPLEHIDSAVTYGVGAKVALTLKKIKYVKAKSATRGVIKATWAWNRQPSTQNYDLLAFSWGKNFGSLDSESFGKAYCKDVHGKVWDTQNLKIWDKNPNSGCAFKFKIRGGGYGYISSGYAQVTMRHSEKAINSVETRVTYGHTAVSLEPSVSWNGISVTFKKSMMNMGHKNLTLQ